MVNGGGKAKDETVVTVESGDTLSELTAKLNEQNGTDYTYEEIALLNGITDPDTIYAGQTIVFPGTRQPESGSDSGSSGSGSGSDSSGGSFGSGSNDSSSTNNELSYFYSPIYKEKVDKLRRTQGITGNAMGRKKIVGKGAWEVKNKWTDEYRQKYREYAPKKIEEYRTKNIKFTCEDLGLSVLIDFASENNLPVTITNGSGKYSSSDPNFKSPEEFKVKVLSTTGAKDMLANTVGIFPSQSKPGDLICMDTGEYDGEKDGFPSHIQMIANKSGTILGIRQGGKINSLFYSATYGSPSYAGLEINGRAYDYNHDIYYGYKNGVRYEFVNAFTEYGMSFRSWDFDRM